MTGYTYTGPHQLTSVSIGGISNALTHDLNGNVVLYHPPTGPDTTLTYDTRNNVTRIHVGPNTSTIVARDQFWYDTDDQRVQSLESWDESGTLRTRRVLYLGGDVEEVRAPANATHDRIVRLQVTAAVRAIARRRASDQVWEAWYYEYALRDHLGSVDVITNSAGVVQQKTSFDPYGGRRSTTWNADLPATGLAALRDWQDSRGSRGFTDHEHLNRTGFVHMSGRVYDPRIGRFVSPDPIVQAPWFSQSYNRYAYVFGSPMSYTDPSGYTPFCESKCQVMFNPDGFEVFGYAAGMVEWSIAFPDVPVAGGIGVVTFPVLPNDIPKDVPPTPPEPPFSVTGENSERYATSIEALSGKPYKLGANGPDAFDCSSTVCHGIRTVHETFGDYSADQIYRKFITPLSGRDALARGDLIFYDYTSDGRIDHVVTALGQGKILHPSSGAGELQIKPINYLDSYMSKRGGTIYYGRINWGAVAR